MLSSRAALTRLLAMQVPADMADWLDMVAIGALLAFVWSAPPVAFAWLAVAMAVPPVTLGLLLGVWVDRWPLRPTLVLSNLGRALATAALLLVPDWPSLVAVVALRAVADSAFGPAKQAMLQAVVPPERLVAANGLSQAVNQATKVAAPAVGAGFLLVLDPRGVFAANAVLSLLATLIASSLPASRSAATPPGEPGTRAPSVWGEMQDGFRLLAVRPILRGAVLLMVAGTFAVFTYDTQLAPLVRALGQEDAVLGLLLAALGAGGLLGSLGLIGLLGRLPALATTASASLFAGLLVGALGVSELLRQTPELPPFLALGFALGVASSMARVPLRAMIQAETPPGMMGRVAALTEALSVSTLLVAPFCGAALATATSVGAAFTFGAGLMLLVAAGAVGMARPPRTKA